MNRLLELVLGVDIRSVCFTETTEVASQPLYAVVQKKPKDKPVEDKSSGDTDSKTTAGNFYVVFYFIFVVCLDKTLHCTVSLFTQGYMHR